MSASLNDKLEAFFKSRPLIWVDGKELAEQFGGYGWRSRVSDVRRSGLRIDNRVETHRTFDGQTYKVSEYRYVPDLPTRVEPSGQVAFL
jgi:hypothetical protein